jgi:hypothetical protein
MGQIGRTETTTGSIETTRFELVNGIKYPVFDITQKYQEKEDINKDALAFKQKRALAEQCNILGLKSGDHIYIISGYNSDMIYKVTILGFNNEDIYLVWDCYWFPVQKKRIVNLKD